jgi:amino acid transporter
MPQPTGEGLIRAIRRWDLIAMAVNAIIGAGIFGLPSVVFARIGVWSLLAFVVCALVASFIVLCFAEVSSRFTETGGPYLYAREAFGPVVGFEVGWMTWIARLTAFAANCNLLVGYLSFIWPAAASPGWRALIIVAVVGALTVVNFVGVRSATLINDAFAVAKLLPLALFISVGLFFIHRDCFALAARPPFGDFSASVLLLIYAFSGFEMATIPGGESRNPRGDMPRALLIAIALVAGFYMLIQVTAIGTLPGLASSTRPLADAARLFLGATGAAVISAAALISIIGNLHVTLLVASRLPFAMAERRELPRFIAKTHPRFHTPYVAILITAAAMAVLTLSGTFVYAATISVIARLLAYAATCLALPVLRRRPDAPSAVFTAPAGVAVSILSLLLIGWLLSNSTASQARDAGLAAVFGFVVYLASRIARARANAS